MTPRESTSRAGHYWDAVTSMRARQLAFRLRRALPARMLATGISEGPPPGWRQAAGGIGLEQSSSSSGSAPPHADRTWRAFGHKRAFGDDDFWTRPEEGLLFLFHLHSFVELARYAATPGDEAGDTFWEEVARDWLVRCGKPRLPAWHPYPTSGRLVAWCAALSHASLLSGIREQMLASAWTQIRWLKRCVEHDIGGNHVLRNAIALVVGGACLGDRRTEEGGRSLLKRELGRQLLADGAHEERSPCYHRLILEDLRDVRAVLIRTRGEVPDWLEEAITEMAAWLTAITGPDGEVPPLNDGWDGPPSGGPAEPRTPVRELRGSGHVVLERSGAQALFDVGPLAPPHLPAHAHADALSVLVWAGGRPVLIDPGSCAYTGSARNRYRGTAAHNTVEVDGADQCEFWGSFRAAYMPLVLRGPVVELGPQCLAVRATHDGYSRLADPTIHERTLVWLGADGLVVIDRIHCRTRHETVSRLHFHEAVEHPQGDLPGGLRYAPLGAGEDPRTAAGSRAPALGTEIPIPLVIRKSSLGPGQVTGWALTRPEVKLSLDEASLVVERRSHPSLELALGDPALEIESQRVRQITLRPPRGPRSSDRTKRRG